MSLSVAKHHRLARAAVADAERKTQRERERVSELEREREREREQAADARGRCGLLEASMDRLRSELEKFLPAAVVDKVCAVCCVLCGGVPTRWCVVWVGVGESKKGRRIGY